ALASAHPPQARLPAGPPRGGGSSRRGRLRCMLRTGGLLPHPVPRRGLDPALHRPDLSVRWRATPKVAWPLLWPDSHRLVDVSFQDTRGVRSLDCARKLASLGMTEGVES